MTPTLFHSPQTLDYENYSAKKFTLHRAGGTIAILYRSGAEKGGASALYGAL